MNRQQATSGLNQQERQGAERVLRNTAIAGNASRFADWLDRVIKTLRKSWTVGNLVKVGVLLYPVCLIVCFVDRNPLDGLFWHILKSPFLALVYVPAYILSAYIFYLLLIGFRMIYNPVWEAIHRSYNSKRGQFETYSAERNLNAELNRAGYSAEAEQKEMEQFMTGNANYSASPGRKWASDI